MFGPAAGVDGVDLRVEPGECFGFLGPNGAGKTTFIRLVLGLVRASSGSVSVMGHDPARDRIGALAQIGYLPGELGLYPMLTGRRTLDALACLHPRPPVLREELCDTLELDDYALRKRVREYSRGMKQKLGLVAALQHDPPLAILDEPTGGLDPVIQARLLRWLAARSRAGCTVFFSSHVLAEVEELCDRVGMIRNGRLLFTGTPEDLGHARTRNVEVSFARSIEPALYAGAGIGPVTVDGLRHRFVFSGESGHLLDALSRLPVANVAIERASLDEVFRELYSA
jgi:ABC-2 type transport system ATP-binding protein